MMWSPPGPSGVYAGVQGQAMGGRMSAGGSSRADVASQQGGQPGSLACVGSNVLALDDGGAGLRQGGPGEERRVANIMLEMAGARALGHLGTPNNRFAGGAQGLIPPPGQPEAEQPNVVLDMAFGQAAEHFGPADSGSNIANGIAHGAMGLDHSTGHPVADQPILMSDVPGSWALGRFGPVGTNRGHSHDVNDPRARGQIYQTT